MEFSAYKAEGFMLNGMDSDFKSIPNYLVRH